MRTNPAILTPSDIKARDEKARDEAQAQKDVRTLSIILCVLLTVLALFFGWVLTDQGQAFLVFVDGGQ